MVADIRNPGLTLKSCTFAAQTDRPFVHLASGTGYVCCSDQLDDGSSA